MMKELQDNKKRLSFAPSHKDEFLLSLNQDGLYCSISEPPTWFRKNVLKNQNVDKHFSVNDFDENIANYILKDLPQKTQMLKDNQKEKNITKTFNPNAKIFLKSPQLSLRDNGTNQLNIQIYAASPFKNGLPKELIISRIENFENKELPNFHQTKSDKQIPKSKSKLVDPVQVDSTANFIAKLASELNEKKIESNSSYGGEQKVIIGDDVEEKKSEHAHKINAHKTDIKDISKKHAQAEFESTTSEKNNKIYRQKPDLNRTSSGKSCTNIFDTFQNEEKDKKYAIFLHQLAKQKNNYPFVENMRQVFAKELNAFRNPLPINNLSETLSLFFARKKPLYLLKDIDFVLDIAASPKPYETRFEKIEFDHVAESVLQIFSRYSTSSGANVVATLRRNLDATIEFCMRSNGKNLARNLEKAIAYIAQTFAHNHESSDDSNTQQRDGFLARTCEDIFYCQAMSYRWHARLEVKNNSTNSSEFVFTFNA